MEMLTFETSAEKVGYEPKVTDSVSLTDVCFRCKSNQLA